MVQAVQMISSFQCDCIASELIVYIWLLWFTVEKQKIKEILERNRPYLQNHKVSENLKQFSIAKKLDALWQVVKK